MSQDPDLYGQRPAKRSKHLAVSSSLDFAARLTSYISTGANEPSSGIPPPPRVRKRSRGGGGGGPDEKNHATATTTATTSARPKRRQAVTATARSDSKLTLRDTRPGEEEDALARSRRRLEEKAKLYKAMKRGDHEPGTNEAEVLVDFDAKWAESRAAKGSGAGRGADGSRTSLSSSDSSDSGSDPAPGSDDDDDGKYSRRRRRRRRQPFKGGEKVEDVDMVEYEDEYGRLRRVTRAEKEKMDRSLRRGRLDVEELGRMSARPARPSDLIHGDIIQPLSFSPDDQRKMEELARNRDRSPTPPEQTHYDADREIRAKGAGFFKFSKDEDARTEEMRALHEARRDTEQVRQDREDRLAARRQELEQRRKDVEARKAKKLADRFLQRLDA